MKLVVGLGNPGKEYLRTRHNLGHLTINRLASRLNVELKRNRTFKSEIGRYTANPALLAKPLTFINLSGTAVRKLQSKYDISLSDILVICDDFSLPLGKTRLRMKGSSGGHKGLQSIIDQLKSEDFPRLRLGIGPLPLDCNPKEFVLSEFFSEEKETVKEMISAAGEIVKKFISCRL
jgi:PTH1 family peptidyl-tRNA hydrolase